MFRYFTRRSRAVWEVIVVALVLIAGSVSTMPVAHANGHTTVPSVSSTPSTSPTPGGKATGPKPNFFIYGGETGETSDGATSNAFCNGHLYTAWTGADDHVNVAWDFYSNPFGSGFSGKVTYADTAYNLLVPAPGTNIYTRPALACWQASGDTTRLWIFFTGTNQRLYLGYYEPGDENQQSKTVSIHLHTEVPNQSSNRSPALAPQGSTLRVGWVGDGNGYLNFESTTNGAYFGSLNTDRDSTADGGFGMTVWCVSGVCKLWFAYPGTDQNHYIYVEYFNFNAGTWTDPPNAHHTADFTCHICDLTLVLQSGTLRIPYAGSGGYDNLNIDSSTDGNTWSNDQSEDGALWGAGAAVDNNNHFWVTFPNYNSFSTTNLQILIFQYN